LPPDGILPRAKFTSRPKSCVLVYWQRYCTALQQRVLANLCSVVQGMELRNFCRGRRLYSAGQSSRRESAHILVLICNVHDVEKISSRAPQKIICCSTTGRQHSETGCQLSPALNIVYLRSRNNDDACYYLKASPIYDRLISVLRRTPTTLRWAARTVIRRRVHDTE